jgi:hypothetical protein
MVSFRSDGTRVEVCAVRLLGNEMSLRRINAHPEFESAGGNGVLKRQAH